MTRIGRLTEATFASGPSAWAPFGRTVATLTAGGLLVTCQTYVSIPLFPVLADAWGTSESSVTLIPTVFALAYGLSQLFWGRLSDRLGRRRVMAGGLVLTGLFTAAMGATGSLTAALAIAALQGFAASSFSPGALAHLGESIVPARRAFAISIVTTSFFVAGVVGQTTSQGIDQLLGWRWVFTLFGATCVVVAACVWAALAGAAEAQQHAPRSFAAARQLVTNARLVRAMVASVAILGTFVGLYTALSLMGPGELSDGGAAVLWLRASALPGLLAVPFLVRALSRTNPGWNATVAFLLAATMVALLVPAGDNIVLVGLLVSVFVVAIATTSPLVAEVLGRDAGAARGTVMGLWGVFVLIGASAGPQLARLVQPAGFEVAALALAAWLVAAAVLIERRAAS